MKRVCFWPYIGFIDSLDALPIAIFLPDTVDSGSVITPVVRGENLGFMSASIPVRLQIGDEYNQLRSKVIPPNREDTLVFPIWRMNETGWVQVRCTTELANDEKAGNDLIVDSVYVPPGGVGVAVLAQPLVTIGVLPAVMTPEQITAISGRFAVLEITGRVRSGVFFIRTPVRM